LAFEQGDPSFLILSVFFLLEGHPAQKAIKRKSGAEGF